MFNFKILGALICTTTLYLLINRIKRNKMKSYNSSVGIFITGCDSGLGYSMALYCNKLGLTVFAGCKNVNGEGAMKLKLLDKMYVLPLDVKDIDSISHCLTIIKHHQDMDDIQMKILVNNAGVMMFGEFHWLTEEMISEQINVNLLGPMRVTKTFMSLLRINQGRIINISSHCAREPLPGLSVYGGSKSGLLAWSNALRVELNQYNVEVVSFMPGSFVRETCILSNQAQYSKTMLEEMAAEDSKFYKSYFDEYNMYLSYVRQPCRIEEIDNKIFYNNFQHAILSVHPYHLYCYSPIRYAFYHFLLKIAPVRIHDWLVVKFTGMPRWKPST